MRCVRMGSRAADESAATEGARPDDGGPHGGPENKTQPKEEQTREGLPRKTSGVTNSNYYCSCKKCVKLRFTQTNYLTRPVQTN